MENIIKKAGVLVEAIPYIHAFRRKVFVIKYGGSILDDPKIRHNVLEDIVFLSYVGIRAIIVHGGGPHISSRMKENGIKSAFHNGIRITNEEALIVVKEELDKLNQKIVDEIRELRGEVVGLKGSENILKVEKKKADIDLGFVGTITGVNQSLLDTTLEKGNITVVSPLGASEEGQLYNINGDEVASALSTAMQAEKLVLLTNVPGVMRDFNDPDSLISSLDVDQVDQLIKSNIIQGGMIPKVNSCVEALKLGVKKTHIVDARMQHALLLEIFTDQGVGTQIIP